MKISILLLLVLLAGCTPTQTSSVILTCTAVPDGSYVGQAKAYDLRYAVDNITENNWGTCVRVNLTQVPKKAGEIDTFKVSGLYSGVVYYFAVKVISRNGDISPLSNVAVKPIYNM